MDFAFFTLVDYFVTTNRCTRRWRGAGCVRGISNEKRIDLETLNTLAGAGTYDIRVVVSNRFAFFPRIKDIVIADGAARHVCR